MNRRLTVIAFLVCALSTAVLLSACGGGGSSSSSSGGGTEASTGETSTEAAGGEKEISIDVGTETPITFPAGTEPKVGVFIASGTGFQEALREGAEKVADEHGVSVTFFDSKYEPATQLAQLQNALQTKEFNAWMFENYAGPATCSDVKEKAPEAGIVVSQITVLTCEEGKPAGEESWTPGTLNSVGASSTSTSYDSFVKEVLKITGPDPKVGVLTGPPNVTTTELLADALKENGIDPVIEVNTNYTTPDGLAKTQNMLQSNPEITALVSIYGDITNGAVKAVESAGKTGEIEVFDLGTNTGDIEAIKEGKMTASVPYYPRTVAEVSLTSIIEAFEGKPVERFYDGSEEGTADKPHVVTKANVDAFKPQY